MEIVHAAGSKVCQVTSGYGCGQVKVVTAGNGAVLQLQLV